MPDNWQPWPDLARMMAEAKAKNLWFRSPYQDLWFSPAELEAAWARGQFRWGAMNWQLLEPSVRRRQLEQDATRALEEIRNFEGRAKG